MFFVRQRANHHLELRKPTAQEFKTQFKVLIKLNNLYHTYYLLHTYLPILITCINPQHFTSVLHAHVMLISIPYRILR